MVDQCGHKDAEDDGQGAPKLGSQQYGEQLGLVAHLAERDHAGGYEESFHKNSEVQRRRGLHVIPGPSGGLRYELGLNAALIEDLSASSR